MMETIYLSGIREGHNFFVLYTWKGGGGVLQYFNIELIAAGTYYPDKFLNNT